MLAPVRQITDDTSSRTVCTWGCALIGQLSCRGNFRSEGPHVTPVLPWQQHDGGGRWLLTCSVCVCVCEVAASHRHRRRAKIRLWWKELQWLHFPECPSALASFLLPCASFGAFGMASAGSLQLDAEWNHMCSLLSFKQTRAVSNVSNVQSLFSLRGRERWVMGGPRQSDSGSTRCSSYQRISH